MSEYKYKLTLSRSANEMTKVDVLETDDIGIIRELCGLSKAVEVKVDTPNESIDPEWNKFLDEMRRKAKQEQHTPRPYVTPFTPQDTPWIKPLDKPYQPWDNKIQDPLFPQTTITC